MTADVAVSFSLLRRNDDHVGVGRPGRAKKLHWVRDSIDDVHVALVVDQLLNVPKESRGTAGQENTDVFCDLGDSGMAGTGIGSPILSCTCGIGIASRFKIRQGVTSS